MKRMISVLSLVFVMTLTVSGYAITTSQTPDHLSKKQLSALVATAKTPAEHERIANYYRVQANDDLVQSRYHAGMATQFKTNPVASNSKFSRQTVDHCAYLAQSLKDQSVKAENLARQHDEMAKDSDQK